MNGNWKERLRSGLEMPVAQRERRLFQELNPELDHSPILKAPPKEPRPAAVLIGIRDLPDPTVILTLRAPTMPSHAGQISLPGGGPKDGDEGFIGTALREAEEEVGLPRSAIEVMGEVGPHFGGLGYVVTPVLGLVDPSVPVEACPREVSEAFEVPLATLLDLDNHVEQDRNFAGVDYKMFAVPSHDMTGRHWNIWGLTAGILRTMADIYHAGD